ncbi:hypothetical protein JOM56_012616 [Amanita muscaria]
MQLKEKRPGDFPSIANWPKWYWGLISMQRFGPSPSYLTLRIPGLNAPIPERAREGRRGPRQINCRTFFSEKFIIIIDILAIISIVPLSLPLTSVRISQTEFYPYGYILSYHSPNITD